MFGAHHLAAQLGGLQLGAVGLGFGEAGALALVVVDLTVVAHAALAVTPARQPAAERLAFVAVTDPRRRVV